MAWSTNSTATTTRDWSSLPDEIWSAIGTHLSGDRFDATRFRSVCSSFRSFLPKFGSAARAAALPRFSFSLPPSSSSPIAAFVSLTAVYKLQLPLSSPSSPAWLVKVDFAGKGSKIVVLDAVSCRRIFDIDALLSFRLSDFRISEIAKCYSLRYVHGSATVAGVNKVVLWPGSSGSSEKLVFVIYDGGRLGFAKKGDGDITPINDRILDYDDIVVFRGQPYVVDRWGTVSWIDDSMKLVQYSPPMTGDGSRKHLVVCDGELYAVERYLDESGGFSSAQSAEEAVGDIFLRGHFRRQRRRADHLQPKAASFKVYKLDEEKWGGWVEVKTLGNMSFLLMYDRTLAIEAKEYDGFEANCIYFTEQLDLDSAVRRLGRLCGCVFSLEDGTIEGLELTPGYSNLLNKGE